MDDKSCSGTTGSGVEGGTHVNPSVGGTAENTWSGVTRDTSLEKKEVVDKPGALPPVDH